MALRISSFTEGSTPSKQTAWEFRCPGTLALGLAIGELASTAAANHQARGRRQPAALKADTKDKHEKLGSAGKRERTAAIEWSNSGHLGLEYFQSRLLSRLLCVRLTRDVSFWSVFSFIPGRLHLHVRCPSPYLALACLGPDDLLSGLDALADATTNSCRQGAIQLHASAAQRESDVKCQNGSVIQCQ